MPARGQLFFWTPAGFWTLDRTTITGRSAVILKQHTTPFRPMIVPFDDLELVYQSLRNSSRHIRANFRASIRRSPDWGCGRDASYLAPPAQIRTCSFPAYGSYLESLTAMLRLGQGWRIVVVGAIRSLAW